ncbi:MAG: class I mannose-6-phosphate isomerase [Candidatus Eremiobacteraeota bacterium]|nr:class I mannose-6-phosphate isomerase [Candidatus Eremiobacteraeota bacterium]
MSDNLLYPYVLTPKVVPAIWGGDALVKQFHKPGDPNAKLGESWECWDENTVSNGGLAGKSLAQLRAQLGEDLLGNLPSAQIFPILTKIIDARGALSVQVHPDDAYAQRVEHQRNGKTECWYVLHAEPDAKLVLGWNRDTTREEYERRVADGTLGEILRHVPVEAGDAFYLPAGTLHAIGAGIIVFETQQASDLTYRIFDWNRVDAQGKPRELHVQKAGDVLDYKKCTAGAIAELPYTLAGVPRTALIADPRFLVERIALTAKPHMLSTEDRPLIFMTLENAIELECEDGSATLEPYQTALVPAGASEVRVRAVLDNAHVMLVTPPARADAMEERLEVAGVPHECIDQFLRQFRPRVRT